MSTIRTRNLYNPHKLDNWLYNKSCYFINLKSRYHQNKLNKYLFVEAIKRIRLDVIRSFADNDEYIQYHALNNPLTHKYEAIISTIDETLNSLFDGPAFTLR